VRALARLRCARRAHHATPPMCVRYWDAPAVAVRCPSRTRSCGVRRSPSAPSAVGVGRVKTNGVRLTRSPAARRWGVGRRCEVRDAHVPAVRGLPTSPFTSTTWAAGRTALFTRSGLIDI
jgi:hypothetical protein